jgi:hypothetical protein
MTSSVPPPTSADIGRVYLDPDGVRQMLSICNPADNCEYDVLVTRVESVHGVHPKKWLDFRTLTPTDERIQPAR